MTRKIQVHQVDAFTREPFTGNPTGVVLNADGLTEAQMLAIARELNNAETAFILSPDGEDHTVRARFFTPRSEAGFVGHATVAAQYVLSRRHDAPRLTCYRAERLRGAGSDRSPRPGSSTSRYGAPKRIAASRFAAAPRPWAASSTTASDSRCSMRWRSPPRVSTPAHRCVSSVRSARGC